MNDELELWRHCKDAETKRRNKKALMLKAERKAYISFIIVMFITGLLFILRLCVVDINCVSGISMYPTLNDKDLLLVEKFDTTSINRYDIVTIDTVDKSGETMRIIKRVYGLPGEKIEIHMDGSVYINGVRLADEHQILDTVADSTGQDVTNQAADEIVYEAVLNIGQYYVLGDNRAVSQDSRYYGPFDRDDIKGVVVCRIYPFTGIYETEIVETEKE